MKIEILFLVLIFCFEATIHAQPPGVPASNELYKKGFLDVTLLGADPTGTNISTAAIRNAVKLARNYRLVCFFPSGTYLVDDTIRCMKAAYYQTKWKADSKVCILQGSTTGSRPLIQLVNNPELNRFNSESNPMPVFWFYSMSAWAEQPTCEGADAAHPIYDPNCGQANINFDQMIKGIDINLGGLDGAIGVTHPGAQGATIEDMRIDATGAFAGLCNPPGQAGGTYNVEIEGGNYGIYMVRQGSATVKNQQARFQILSGCILKNQDTAPIKIDLSHPMVIVGFHIIKTNGPINIGLPTDGLSLIDGVIEVGSGTAINGNGSSIYMKNVYVKGATLIASGLTPSNPALWTRVEEYSFCPGNANNVINGTTNKELCQSITENLEIDAGVVSRAMILKHVWDEETFPNFQMTDAVNVKDASKMNNAPAKGDGSDDTAALEYAIANYPVIFLPKGTYTTKRTLVLKANTQIFGTARTLSTINASATEDWDSSKGTSLLETVSDPDAETSVSFLNISSSNTRPLTWKAGKNSMIRSINAGRIIVNGNGGGKLVAIKNTHSQLTVDGTSQPLMMYATNPERTNDPQYEIKNSQNVQIFYLKSEAGASDGSSGPNTSLKISNSSNISVYAGTGNINLSAAANNRGIIEVLNSNDITVTHVRPFAAGTGWYIIKEVNGANPVVGLSADSRLAFYRKGNRIRSLKWNGSASSDWNTATNWTPNVIPIASDNLTIPNTGISPVNNQTLVTPATCNNLSIESGATLTLNSGKILDVNGILSYRGTGRLNIKSDATGTGSLIIKGSVMGSGTAIVERWMNASKWNLVSAPVSTHTVAGFLASNTNIPTTSANRRGMMDYNSTTDSWNSFFVNGADNGSFVSGKGYAMRISGDNHDKVVFSGNLAAGTVSTTGLVPSIWNLVGNPYTSAIGINSSSSSGAKFLTANLSNLDPSYAAIYVWEATDAQNAGGQGQYTPINNLSAAFEVQQGQAFFVRMKSEKNNLVFTPDMQIHNSTLILKSTKIQWPAIQLAVSSEGKKSTATIAFNPKMSKGLDPTYDAGLFKSGSGFYIYSRLLEDDNQTPFSLQALPGNGNDSFEIPLGLEYLKGGEVIFSAETFNLPSSCSFILEDKYNTQFTDLSINSYRTTIETNSILTNRFVLHTSSSTTSVNGNKIELLKAYRFGNMEIHISGKLAKGAIAKLYDLQGKTLLIQQLEESDFNIINQLTLCPSLYLLKIEENGKSYTFKL